MERRDFLKSAGAAVGAGAVGGVLADLGVFDQAADAATARAGAAGPVAGEAGRRPNIIFFLVDELRFPSVFPDGITTPAQFLAAYMPNTYQLWLHGVKFTSHFAAGTACTPSRATLVTGLYPHQEWELATRTAAGPSLDRAFPTYGRLLRRLGYETPYIGKWHLSNPPANLPQDYLEAYGFDGMTIPDPTGTNGQGAADDPDTADMAVSWLQSRARSEAPFCLTVGFVNPHDKQYFWGGTQGDLYEELFQKNGVSPFIKDYMSVPGEDNPPPQGFPVLPPNWESEAELTKHNKPSTHVLFREFQSAVWGACTDDPQDTGFSVALSPNSHPVAPFYKGISPFSYWQRGLDCYTYIMGLVDQQIGKIVANVPASLLRNTVFVVTSDHGEYGGAHGLLSGKLGTLYDEAWHVPLIVADATGRFLTAPGIQRTQLTSMVDLAPLLVTLGNRGSTSWMTGPLTQLYGERLDLARLLRDPGAPGRQHVLFATDEIIPDAMNYLHAPTHALGVRTAEAKLGTYSRWYPGTTRPVMSSMELEFYDYATPEGRAETFSTPDDPRAKAMLAALFNQYVPQQEQESLPSFLR
ncbi:MAG: sulfatase-like hydrolase/transferase, partial [Streptosporangiaceae bacterium]